LRLKPEKEIKAKNIISKSNGRSKKKDEKVIVDKETRPCEKERGNRKIKFLP